jgi:hypothetical protein
LLAVFEAHARRFVVTVPSPVTLWELRGTSGKLVTCVLSVAPRTATLSVFIGAAEIVTERFPLEAEARKYAKGLHADFVNQGCVAVS